MVKIKTQHSQEWNPSFDEDDLFDRKWFWEILENIIMKLENRNLVLWIDAPWGEWKSHFLKMWSKYLVEEKQQKVIYFDAFKNDFIEDPFVAMLGEVISIYKSNQTIKDSIIEKWKNVMKSILPLWGKVIARAVLWGDIDWVSEKLEELVDSEIEKKIGDTLDDYMSKEDNIKTFQDTLEWIIWDNWERLIFIVDELDRCRPDFALRLLERMKHFFGIPWVYFVLWVNKKQLEVYIQKIYWNIDAWTYLQKFIDFEFLLPKNHDIDRWDYKKYITRLFQEYNSVFSSKKDDSVDFISRLLLELSQNLKISFRELEKIINHIVILRLSTAENALYLKPFSIILIFLKLLKPEVYKNIQSGEVLKDKIIEELQIENLPWDGYKDYLINEFSFLYDENLTEDQISNYNWLHRYWSFWTRIHERVRLRRYSLDKIESCRLL